MRVNIYAEEITDRIEIVEKTTLDGTFTGIRFYLELPVTKKIIEETHAGPVYKTLQVSGPFQHHPGDDDSAAVTFWGKTALRETLTKAIEAIDEHYNKLARAKREAMGEFGKTRGRNDRTSAGFRAPANRREDR